MISTADLLLEVAEAQGDGRDPGTGSFQRMPSCMSALVEGEGPGHTPACGAPSPEAEPDRPDFSSSFKRAYLEPRVQ